MNLLYILWQRRYEQEIQKIIMSISSLHNKINVLFDSENFPDDPKLDISLRSPLAIASFQMNLFHKFIRKAAGVWVFSTDATKHKSTATSEKFRSSFIICFPDLSHNVLCVLLHVLKGTRTDRTDFEKKKKRTNLKINPTEAHLSRLGASEAALIRSSAASHSASCSPALLQVHPSSGGKKSVCSFPFLVWLN